MPKPFLGKLDLKWCESCNVPLLGAGCSTCGNDGKKVTYSPPGDIRPAFEQDIAVIRKTIAEFDPEVDMLRGVIVLNAISSKYELEEVISGGQVLGFLRERRSFAPRADFAAAMRSRLRVVEADPGARPSLMKSSNLMAPGVLSMSEGIEVGDEVVVNIDGETIATGKARMSTSDVGTVKKGVAVKVRHRIEGHGFPDAASTLDDAVAANADTLVQVEERAVRGVKWAWESTEVPKMVSFSGGKDSLATLLLVVEAGYSPMMFFVDTGLELPGTLDYIERTAEEHGLDLTVAEAGDAFLNGLKHFGPPAKDYRWCCKTDRHDDIRKVPGRRYGLHRPADVRVPGESPSGRQLVQSLGARSAGIFSHSDVDRAPRVALPLLEGGRGQRLVLQGAGAHRLLRLPGRRRERGRRHRGARRHGLVGRSTRDLCPVRRTASRVGARRLAVETPEGVGHRGRRGRAQGQTC